MERSWIVGERHLKGGSAAQVHSYHFLRLTHHGLRSPVVVDQMCKLSLQVKVRGHDQLEKVRARRSTSGHAECQARLNFREYLF